MSEQILTLRMNLLGGMNEFVKTATSLKVYIDLWQHNCISAEATEEDLEIIARDVEAFTYCVYTFGYICLKCL